MIQKKKYIKRAGQLAIASGLIVHLNASAVSAPRLLHYPLVCNPADQCRIDCFQEGRTILSSVRIAPNDRAVLVLSDGFSDRLKPMWIEVRPGDKRGNRTVLMPPGAFCDMQGITVRPLAP
ncbi:MAG: hypothetical protein AAF493_26065 [Pseudomonadota bacterium]